MVLEFMHFYLLSNWEVTYASHSESLLCLMVVEILYEYETVSQVDARVKMSPKVSHGWTVKYDVADEAVVKFAEVNWDILEWFAKSVNSGKSLASVENLLSGM